MWECSFHQISDILIESQNIANIYEKNDPFFYSEENLYLLSGISPVKSLSADLNFYCFCLKSKSSRTSTAENAAPKKATSCWNTHPTSGINSISHQELLRLLLSPKAKNLQENKSFSSPPCRVGSQVSGISYIAIIAS